MSYWYAGTTAASILSSVLMSGGKGGGGGMMGAQAPGGNLGKLQQPVNQIMDTAQLTPQGSNFGPAPQGQQVQAPQAQQGLAPNPSIYDYIMKMYS